MSFVDIIDVTNPLPIEGESEGACYNPFSQPTEYIPDVNEYHLCMTEEQYKMLLQAAEGKLGIARQDQYDIKASAAIYRLNGCSADKYADFVRRADQLVTNWQTIVDAMKEVTNSSVCG